MKISRFIKTHIEELLVEWDAFAKTLLPVAAGMSQDDLRDDAKEMLQAIAVALDLETEATDPEQVRKSRGAIAPLPGGAAETHGALRQASGFTLGQLVAEFRALRASILKLWQQASEPGSSVPIDDIMRFNASIDQAMATSIVTYSQHAQNTRDTFLAILGHDLRTPLHTVAMAADYLGKPGVEQSGLDRTSERLRRSAARMVAMVNDLIEYSRAQLGDRMRISPAEFNLKELAEAALIDVSAAYPDCPFELDAPANLKAIVDGARVHQMLTNLLINAAQYRDKIYSVNLAVALERDLIVLRVRNRGPVIAEEFFEAIFNPLVQLTTAADGASRPATSLGLGLHIARTIAVAHEGKISVTSTEKQGTVFTVQLPRVRP